MGSIVLNQSCSCGGVRLYLALRKTVCAKCEQYSVAKVIVSSLIHGCTKFAHFIKYKNFSCTVSLSSMLTGADVRRAGLGLCFNKINTLNKIFEVCAI